MRVMAVLAAMCAVARAQQLVCEPCVRGDDTLKQLGDAGTLLRSRGHELVSVGVTPGGVIQDTQMTRLHDLLGDDPALTDTLADLSDAQLSDMAAAVCNAPDGHCTVTLAATLRCLAGRCHVEHHVIERMQDPPNPTCDPYVKKVTSPATGFGLEWGEGRQQDASPVDHRAWSFGFEGRRRIGRRFGVVGRVDRSNGRDASTDTNGDGRDDVSTGAVTRVSVLAGPTMMFAIGHADATRFAQVDLLGGYLWTLSQPHEDGPAAGVDLSYSLEVARVGVRAITGFGDAKDAHAVLAHVGFVLGAGPNFDYSAGCGHEEKSPTKVALAIDIPLFGFGLSSALDYSVPGFGVEAGYHVANFVDVMARGDLLVFPNSDRERTAYQSVLGGARIDLTEHTASSLRSGFFTTLMAGYAFAAGTEPTTAGSGPVVDASVGWGGEGDDGMAYLRLHGRFGLSPDNYDARAIFLSGGLELRLDRRQWKDRN